MQKLFQQAITLHQQGNFAQAETLYRQILLHSKSNPQVLNALGMLLHSSGRGKECIETLTRAAKLDKTAPHILLNLAEALRCEKRYSEAASAIKRALNLRPNYPEAWLCYGNLFHDQHNYDQAINYYQRVTRHLPNLAAGHECLGVAFLEKEKFQDAISELRIAISLDPNNPSTYLNLGNTYARFKQEQLAIDQYRQCILRAPDHPEASLKLATLLMDIPSVSDQVIEDLLAKANTRLNNHSEYLITLGKLRLRQGDHMAAREMLKSAIENSSSSLAIFYYAHSKKFDAIEDAWLLDKANQLISNSQYSESSGKEDQALIYFGLGKMMDDQASYDAAFNYYKTGNDHLYSTQNHEDTHSEMIADTIRKIFDSKFFEDRPVKSGGNELIFIVGMPRSGTTLVEQIIGSHPMVYGAGELNGIDGLVTSVSTQQQSPYPNCLENISAETITKVSSSYLAQIKSLFQGNHTYIVDKLPHNFLHIGFIKTLFPDAKIINVARNPIDTCLSIYFQKFSTGHAYSYRLEDIAAEYLKYQKLMSHWHTVLPSDIFDLSYEALVNDPGYWSRELIKFLNLDWTDACLTPHQLNRTIKTASHWQARQSIYHSSIGRWQHYRQHLSPLLDIFGELNN